MSKESAPQPFPDQEPRPTEMLGIQGRLVLADQKYLNPDTSYPVGENPAFTSFQNRNYNVFEHAYTQDKTGHWLRNGSHETLTTRKRLWKHAILNKMKNVNEKAWDDVYSPLFSRLGMEVQNRDTDLDMSHATQMYNRYLSPLTREPQESGIKRFVQDIIQTYTSQDGKLDKTKIIDNIDTIKRLANIFGKKSSEMVEQLILAETNLLTDPTLTQKLTTQTPRGTDIALNALSPKERDLLAFINAGNKTTEDEDEELTGSGELPIIRRENDIMRSIAQHDNTIVIGGTGSGKTVGIPPMVRKMMKQMKAEGQTVGKLYVTQPTQVNTSSIASRVADMEEDATLGKEIGYQHGDDRNLSPENDTVFSTERLLVMALLEDPLLSDASFVMVDEVHVRSTHTEELLALLKIAQKLREAKGMQPLKVIAASATVNKDELQQYFGTEAIEVKGRTYPVETEWAERNYTTEELPQQAALEIARIEEEGVDGDAVIFVAGNDGMTKTSQAIQRLNLDNVEIIPLHRGSPEEQKEKAKQPPTPGKRRVFVATNFAETGITINGLKYVINTGEEFENTIDPTTGLTYMQRIKKSQAAINQSSGRVGRNAPGNVINLFTKADFDTRPEYPTPEIQRSDITELVMDIKMLRKTMQEHYQLDLDIAHLPFLSKIDEQQVAFAEETLRAIGAINQDGTPSDIGERMYKLPTGFRGARLVAEAEKHDKGIWQMATIAAFPEGKNPYAKDPQMKEKAMKTFGVPKSGPTSDFLTYLNIWKQFQRQKPQERRAWAEAQGLDYATLAGIEKTREKILRRSKGNKKASATDDELAQMIMVGYADRRMQYNKQTDTYIWPRQRVATFNLKIGRDSVVKGQPEYIIAGANSKVEPGVKTVYLSNVQAINPE